MFSLKTLKRLVFFPKDPENLVFLVTVRSALRSRFHDIGFRTKYFGFRSLGLGSRLETLERIPNKVFRIQELGFGVET